MQNHEILSFISQDNLNEPWRAMIIKDNDGDFSIVLARWVGLREGVPGVPGVRGVHGNY